MDKQSHDDSIYRTNIASHGKNQIKYLGDVSPTVPDLPPPPQYVYTTNAEKRKRKESKLSKLNWIKTKQLTTALNSLSMDIFQLPALLSHDFYKQCAVKIHIFLCSETDGLTTTHPDGLYGDDQLHVHTQEWSYGAYTDDKD